MSSLINKILEALKEVEEDIRTNEINLNRRLECMEMQQANIITLLKRKEVCMNIYFE